MTFSDDEASDNETLPVFSISLSENFPATNTLNFSDSESSISGDEFRESSPLPSIVIASDSEDEHLFMHGDNFSDNEDSDAEERSVGSVASSNNSVSSRRRRERRERRSRNSVRH